MWWWQILVTPYPDVLQPGTTMILQHFFSVAYEIGNKTRCFLMCDSGFPEGPNQKTDRQIKQMCQQELKA